MERIHRWTVGDRLRKAREEAGIGVEEMSAKISRGRNSVTRYERSRSVDVNIVRSYAAFTDTSMQWLLTGNGPDDTGGEEVSAPVTLRTMRRIGRDNWLKQAA